MSVVKVSPSPLPLRTQGVYCGAKHVTLVAVEIKHLAPDNAYELLDGATQCPMSKGTRVDRDRNT